MNDEEQELVAQLEASRDRIDFARAQQAKAALRAAKKLTAKHMPLTAAQRRRVKELMTDEGESRASAEAWVRAFEPEGKP